MHATQQMKLFEVPPNYICDGRNIAGLFLLRLNFHHNTKVIELAQKNVLA